MCQYILRSINSTKNLDTYSICWYKILVEGKSSVIPVRNLLARVIDSKEKKLYLISTVPVQTPIFTTIDLQPDVYELQVVHPWDPQDWIDEIRRAVDLSSGGLGEDDQSEKESEQARRHLDAKYTKMRELTSELRQKDMELAMLLEDKMRVLAEMSGELGLESDDHTYQHLVQVKEGDCLRKEELLKQIANAAKLAFSFNDGNQDNLPSKESLKRTKSSSLPCLFDDPQKLLIEDTTFVSSNHRVSVEMTHCLNKITCMVSELYSSMENIKVELQECKERAKVGYGRYKHNQLVEELRVLKEQLNNERKKLQQYKLEQENEISIIMQSLESTKARLKVMKWSLDEF